MEDYKTKAHYSTEKTKASLDRIIKSFHAYYDVNDEDPIPPFSAEATFRLHDEQYIFVKKAKVSEVDSNEFIYFAEAGALTEEIYKEFETIAWEDGLRRADPKANHRNSDVTVVVVAESIAPEVEQVVKKSKHYISYKFGFHGWSAYRAVAYDLSREKIIFNRRGGELKKVFSNIKAFG